MTPSPSLYGAELGSADLNEADRSVILRVQAMALFTTALIIGASVYFVAPAFNITLTAVKIATIAGGIALLFGGLGIADGQPPLFVGGWLSLATIAVMFLLTALMPVPELTTARLLVFFITLALLQLLLAGVYSAIASYAESLI